MINLNELSGVSALTLGGELVWGSWWGFHPLKHHNEGIKNRAERLLFPQLMTLLVHVSFSASTLSSLEDSGWTRNWRRLNKNHVNANASTPRCRNATCYILRRELAAYTWSTSTAIPLNCI